MLQKLMEHTVPCIKKFANFHPIFMYFHVHDIIVNHYAHIVMQQFTNVHNL